MSVAAQDRRLTSALLLAGAAAGVLVTVTSCLLAALRSGFDVRQHANSLLVLGDWGWVQTVDFVGFGVLMAAFGVGVWRLAWPVRSGLVAAAGLVVYGIGAGVVVGLNPPPPVFGFPPGSTGGYGGYDKLSTSAKIHGIGGMVGFLAVTVACFAFARYFARQDQRAWSGLSAAVGISVLAVCAYLGANASAEAGRFNYLPTWVASVGLWLYLAAVAAKLFGDARGPQR